MSGDVQRVSMGGLRAELEAARQHAPSEVAIAEDGTQSVISWQGTPVTKLWVSGYVDRLIAAGLVKPYGGLGRDLGEAERVLIQKDNDDRLAAWHKALGGLPQEILEAFKFKYERHGRPDGKSYFLQPYEVSRWVRARAVRRIPEGQECEAHEGQWAHSCRECAEDRRRSRAALPTGFMDRLRAEIEKSMDEGSGQ